jgi:L-ascorbate 6-phosphate lactonase
MHGIPRRRTMTSLPAWPPEFLAEIEGDLPGKAPVLWVLGGPSFVYRSNDATIWVDPYFGRTPEGLLPAGIYRTIAIPIDPTGIRRADAVVSTHAHEDHCHEASVTPIVTNTGAQCLAPATSASLMRGWDAPPERLVEVRVGDTFRVRDVEVRVHCAHDPLEPGAVSFVLETCGTSLFVGGDTWSGEKLHDVAEQHAIDYALLAYGGDWYMDADELLDVATVLRTKTLIPFHWEIWRRQTGDLVSLFEAYHRRRPAFRLELPLMGDLLVLGG